MSRKRRKSVNSPVPCKKFKLDLSQQSSNVSTDVVGTSCVNMQHYKTSYNDVTSLQSYYQVPNFYYYENVNQFDNPYPFNLSLNHPLFTCYTSYETDCAGYTEHLKNVLCDCESLLQQDYGQCSVHWRPRAFIQPNPKLDETIIDLIPKIELTDISIDFFQNSTSVDSCVIHKHEVKRL